MNKKEFELNNIVPKPVFGFSFSTLMLFRCIKRKYAEKFRQGQIYFGSPKTWIELEQSGNHGQGDLLEGVFLSVNPDDESKYIKHLKSSSSVDFFDHCGYTFFRRKDILSLRCLCLYGLRDDSFHKKISSDGRAHYHFSIAKEYFSCFTDFKSREEAEKAEQDVQPVVIFINNFHELFIRIRSFLLSLGVKEEEIIISPVEYLDRYTCMFAVVPSPFELLLKDKSFQNQSEVRIIIDSKSPDYLRYMAENNNTISIGSLEDITSIYEYYYDDMSMERWGSKGLLFSLPKPEERQLQDLSYFELEDLLFNILRGTVELNGIPEDWDTWDKKLKPIKDLFLTKFGVLLHVDESKNVSFFNMSQDLLSQSHERYRNSIKCAQFKDQINILINKESFDEAQAVCISVSEDKVLCGPANYYLGKVLSVQQKDTEAIKAFKKSFDNDYKRIESLDGIAAIHFRAGDYLEAIKWYNLVQDEKGYDGRIWCNIGICHIRLKQYKEAIEYFDKGISADINDAFPYYNKGVALYMLKENECAKACMEKAIELDPDNEIYKQEYRKSFPV